MPEFEERADHLTLSEIKDSMVDGPVFKQAKRKLLARGARLLVGPRGVGKTHLMLFAYSEALTTPDAPLVIYANFNRYLHLEPLLKTTTDAKFRFHSWVLARLFIGICEAAELLKKPSPEFRIRDATIDRTKLDALVTQLERGGGQDLYEQYGQFLTVLEFQKAVDRFQRSCGRDRTVLFLDDAALSLSEDYLIAFFEIFRLVKSDTISPKASVYPGTRTTQFGPTFHLSHESDSIPLWLSVQESNYLDFMGSISQRRLQDPGAIDADVDTLLKYIAFGIPRAYLRMLRKYDSLDGNTTQQKVNKIVEDQVNLIRTEYESLGIKLSQYKTVIGTGQLVFDRLVLALVEANSESVNTKTTTVGVNQDGDVSPLISRMFKFLIEVGMLHPSGTVSHGDGREYERYVPHYAFLQNKGLFKPKGARGFSAKDTVAYIQRPETKHPVRRAVSSILNQEELAALTLDLPPCTNCKTPRLSEAQKFCHHCGKQLVSSSQFEKCMKLKLEKVPEISDALIQRIHTTRIKTIRDIYVSQDASNELQRANYIGPIRAQSIIQKVALLVDEFLS